MGAKRSGLPSYAGILSASSGGTEPGTVASEMSEKMPNMARRPLLISASSPRIFCASVFSGNHLNGSYRSKINSGRLPWMGG